MNEKVSGDHAVSAPVKGANPAADSHVLVVDDDDGIRRLLKKYLSLSGYRVSEARDAAHARSLIAALSFDIMVVDVMMPGEDGISLTKWIGGRTPVLLLTAKQEIESRILGLEAGVAAWWRSARTPAAGLARASNDLYLRAAGDARGVESYAGVVGLVLRDDWPRRIRREPLSSPR